MSVLFVGRCQKTAIAKGGAASRRGALPRSSHGRCRVRSGRASRRVAGKPAAVDASRSGDACTALPSARSTDSAPNVPTGTIATRLGRLLMRNPLAAGRLTGLKVMEGRRNVFYMRNTRPLGLTGCVLRSGKV